MRENQVNLLKEIYELKKIIYSLCNKSGCVNFNKCKNNNTVCTKDINSPYRRLIINNGGDIDHYLEIRSQLIEDNFPLVVDIAKKIGGSSQDDLKQEGCLGLCEAIDKFDPYYGTQFSTFAYSYIRKWILNFIRENTTVKVATKIAYLSKLSEDAFDILMQKYKYASKITPKKLLSQIKKLRKYRKMCKLELRESEIIQHLNRLKFESSENRTINFLNNIDIILFKKNEYLNDENKNSFYSLLFNCLNKQLNKQNIQLSEIIKMRFGLGQYEQPITTNEISAAIGCSDNRLINNKILNFFLNSKK